VRGAFIFYSMPLFWLSLLLVILFSIDIRWFPPQAPQGDLAQVLTAPRGLVLPVAALTLVTIALFSRYMRSSAIDSLPRTTSARRRPRASARRSCWAGTCCGIRCCQPSR
jgi:ABC-type dipeptide/oligopeptide/nickel transport system permease component